MNMYRTIIVNKNNEQTEYAQSMLPYSGLAANDILVEMRYTGLSRLDAAVITGHYPGINYPIQPGFDAVGVVIESNAPSFSKGDEVTINSASAGGFASYMSIPESMALPVPMGLSMEDAITLGTPAIAAGMALNFFLSSGINPQSSRVAVTGAAYDAGAIMLALLSRLGFETTAYANLLDDVEPYLKQLGAKEIEHMSKLEEDTEKGLHKPKYHAVFDNAGGRSLSGILKYMHNGSSVAVGACPAESSEISSLPFHCRGVNILGINALYVPLETKLDIWRKLSGDWKLEEALWLSTEISFDELPDYLPALMAGTTKGRIIINHQL